MSVGGVCVPFGHREYAHCHWHLPIDIYVYPTIVGRIYPITTLGPIYHLLGPDLPGPNLPQQHFLVAQSVGAQYAGAQFASAQFTGAQFAAKNRNGPNLPGPNLPRTHQILL